MKYRASLRLFVKKGAIEEDKGAMVTKVEIIKNKLAPPFLTAAYRLDFMKGIDKYEDLWDAAKEMKMLTGGGGGRYTVHFRKGPVKIFQKEWKAMVDRKGGPDKFRDLMTKRAIRLQLMRPYGLIEYSVAESDAEKDPSA